MRKLHNVRVIVIIVRLSDMRRAGWKQISHLQRATTSNPDRWRAGRTSLNYSARWGDFLLWMLSGILAKTFLPHLWCLHNIIRVWQSGRAGACCGARLVDTHRERGQRSAVDQLALCMTAARDLERRCLRVTPIPGLSWGQVVFLFYFLIYYGVGRKKIKLYNIKGAAGQHNSWKP